MSERQEKDPSVDLAGWLGDVGRRAWRPVQPTRSSSSHVPAESGEALVGYLEQLAGRKISTREDIRQFLADLSAQQRDAFGVYRRRRVIKETALLLALVTAFIQYHFLDVSLQIARMPSTLVFVPVEATPQRQRVDAPRTNVRHASAILSAPADQPGVITGSV